MKNLSYAIAILSIVSCNSDRITNRKLDVLPSKTVDATSLLIQPKPAPIPEALMVKAQEFRINPLADTTIFIGDKGSKIHIPKEAFCYFNRDLVKSKVIIKVKDYRNAADMAFSGLPMVYKNEAGEAFNFNSAGMFEISGEGEDGQQIEIAPSKLLKVDYNLVHRNKGINFYKLEKETGEWAEIQKIKTIPINSRINAKAANLHFSLTIPRNVKHRLWYCNEEEDREVPLETVVEENYDVPPSMVAYLNEYPQQSFSVLFTLDTVTGQFVNIRADKRNQDKKYDKELVALVKSLPVCNFSISDKENLSPFKEVYQLKIHRDLWAERFLSKTKKGKLINRAKLYLVNSDSIGKSTIVDGRFLKFWRSNSKATDLNNVKFIVSSNAGHTYPAIVQNLNVPSFGVYNCDQIYRIQNRVALAATYLDEMGDTIGDLKVLSMVDLEINAAFSSDPYHITCNAKGENVLLLFTNSGRFYVFGKEDFKMLTIEGSGPMTFKMKEVTDEITEAKDLIHYLGIEA